MGDFQRLPSDDGDVELGEARPARPAGLEPLALVKVESGDVPVFFPVADICGAPAGDDSDDEEPEDQDIAQFLRPSGGQRRVVLLCECDRDSAASVAVVVVGRVAPAEGLREVPNPGALMLAPVDGTPMDAVLLPDAADPAHAGLWASPTMPITLARFGAPHWRVTPARWSRDVFFGAYVRPPARRPLKETMCHSTPGVTVTVAAGQRRATFVAHKAAMCNPTHLKVSCGMAVCSIAGAAAAGAMLAAGIHFLLALVVGAVLHGAGVMWAQRFISRGEGEFDLVLF